jgi:hypothetical protein
MRNSTPEKNREYQRRCYLRHLPERRAARRRWYAANREKRILQTTAYYHAHRSHYRDLYQRRKPDILAKVKAYAADHPDLYAAIAAKRRMRKISATVEVVKRNEVYQRDGGRCHICGKLVPKHWHLDHLVPLSQGGEHSYKNVAVSCVVCNLRKGTKRCAQLRLI